MTNPDKVLFPAAGHTKRDLVDYYLAVGEGIVRALRERPTQLRRFPDGIEGEQIYQKRVPEKRPEWIEAARVTFPSGRHADELCVTELAQVVWAANLAVIDFHPWPSRRADIEHPDELRIDIDPQPGTDFADAKARRRARARGARRDRLRRLAEDLGQPRHPHRRAGSSRAGSSRSCAGARSPSPARSSGARPTLVTTAWWKEERGERVFIDYNQNARDRTIASAYSVRRAARRDRLGAGHLGRAARRRDRGLHARRRCRRASRRSATSRRGSTTPSATSRVLLEWVERDEAAGVGEAPYPPNFPKMPGEPPRVQPSRRPQGVTGRSAVVGAGLPRRGPRAVDRAGSLSPREQISDREPAGDRAAARSSRPGARRSDPCRAGSAELRAVAEAPLPCTLS